MKREFLQSFKVGDTPLPKEIIDAIMEENGRDINTARAVAVKPYADHDAILAENERLKNAQALCDGKSATQWKALYDQALADHEKQLDDLAFGGMVETAITAMGGRNARAITALLDMAGLQADENRQEAVTSALKDLQRSDGYLFGKLTPPPYAGGTGISRAETTPDTLAGALREKFERK